MLLAGVAILLVKFVVDTIANIPVIGTIGILGTIHSLGILYPLGFALVLWALSHSGRLALGGFLIVAFLIFIAGGTLI